MTCQNNGLLKKKTHIRIDKVCYSFSLSLWCVLCGRSPLPHLPLWQVCSDHVFCSVCKEAKSLMYFCLQCSTYGLAGHSIFLLHWCHLSLVFLMFLFISFLGRASFCWKLVAVLVICHVCIVKSLLSDM